MSAFPVNPLDVIDLGFLPFLEAWELQLRLHDSVAEGRRPDTLLLLEHPHTYTLGRRGHYEDILIEQSEIERLGIDVHHTDRGGEVTYHGPGQIVGYPIIDLRRWGGGPLKYVSSLEQVISESLAELGIEGTSEGHPTGVWVEDRKVAAIGVKVGRRVTTHGFALNVSTDLSHFKNIVPCGMPTAEVTSVSRELGTMVPVGEVLPVVVEKFGKVFGYSPEASQVSYNRRHKIPAAN